MRWPKYVLAAAGVTVVAVAGVLALHLRDMSSLALQSCMEQPPFPGSAWACSTALYAAHPTPEEVAHMNRSGGAIWLLSLPESEARRLLKHFIAAGLDVNAADQNPETLGWTSLHSAVFEGDPTSVRLLLEAGAKVNVLDKRNKSPIDILRSELDQQPDDPKLVEVQKLLTAASR